MSPLVAFLQNIGSFELIIVFIVALIIFGNKLPEVVRSASKTFGQFKRGMQEASDQVRREMEQAAVEADPRPEIEAAVSESLNTDDDQATTDDYTSMDDPSATDDYDPEGAEGSSSYFGTDESSPTQNRPTNRRSQPRRRLRPRLRRTPQRTRRMNRRRPQPTIRWARVSPSRW